MASRQLRPSETELEILKVLWTRGSSTVREVHELLDREGRTVYTTILKLMQIMNQKGFVVRDSTQRSHVYTASVTEDQVKDGFLDGVLKQAFGGSASRMILHALSRKKATKKELGEIRKLLDEMEN